MGCAAVETAMGWVGVLGSEAGVRRVILPRETREKALRPLGGCRPGTRGDELLFEDLLARLRRYFEGEAVSFHDGLDLAGATVFRRAVWRATHSIPYGETRTYAWVAQELGQPNASRAVGRALGANPVPLLVPCHRVIGAGGELRGFSDGLPMKRALLDMERRVGGVGR